MTEAATSNAPDASKPPPRKFERHSCRVKMRCRRAKTKDFAGTAERYVDGFVRNQSLGGLLLETPIYYPVGLKLEVAFDSPDHRQTFLGLVTIKWSSRVGAAWYLGCSTDRMDKF